MIEGLQLIQRLSPTKIDENLLRTNRVAPGNEYKVVGALKFLGLIDEAGRLTQKSQLLKTRGATYTLALQEVIRTAYKDLFIHLPPEEATREQLYNYFITRTGIGREMAIKTTRFFVALCRLAEIPLPAGSSRAKRQGTTSTTSTGGRRKRTTPAKKQPQTSRTQPAPLLTWLGTPFPLVLAITPETAELGEEQLVAFLRKMKAALRRVFTEER
jgi:hypothetical protein